MSEAKAIRAAVTGPGDVRDPRLWSGTPARIVAELERVFDVVHVERMPFSRSFWLVQKVLRRLTGGRVDIMWSDAATRSGSAAARRRLAGSAPDVVFVISSGPLCRLLGREHRVVNVADATGKAIVDYYPNYSLMFPQLREAIVRVSGEAIAGSLLCLYPSTWARRSALEDYGKAADRAVEIAWGPNFTDKPEGRVREITGALRLLFVGYEWERKGGRW